MESHSEETALSSKNKPDPALARPPVVSFIVVLNYSVLTVTSFTVCIPTAVQYVTSFGVPKSWAGWMVGLTPIFCGFVQLGIGPLLKRFPQKKIMIIFCFVNILGACLYALGTQTGWIGTIFIARAIQGAVGGPVYASTYVAKTSGTKVRSLYMQYVGVGIGIGYGCGPLMGALIEVVCQAAGWNSKVVNSSTTPGWLMAMLFALQAVLLWAFMVEPKVGGPPKPGVMPPPTPWSRVCAAFVVVFCTPINVGMWDVHTAYLAEGRWMWSPEYLGLYLGLLNLAAVPFGLLPLALSISDRTGMLRFSALAVLSIAAFWDYQLTTVSEAVLFGFGSVVMLIAAQFMKSFGWGLVSKLPPPSARPNVMAFNAMVYMFGRGLGAIISGYVYDGSNFAIVLTCLNSFLVVYIAATWKLLEVP
ncbi:hypothetical protein TrCOL_g1094 [Triparma columacea]|uniref:Major facilitator superfamily (MFS) profile domain-containing protein n=1 Tax=Triparma columacea TaxID=722753 RepID=A0A9W7L3Q3_9STRA|nr:hypothetical protein TrCOL_g1094 [Triparma columacea]